MTKLFASYSFFTVHLKVWQAVSLSCLSRSVGRSQMSPRQEPPLRSTSSRHGPHAQSCSIYGLTQAPLVCVPVVFSAPRPSCPTKTRHFKPCVLYRWAAMCNSHVRHLFEPAEPGAQASALLTQHVLGEITEARWLLCAGRHTVGARGCGGGGGWRGVVRVVHWQGEVYWKISHDKLALAPG